MDYVSLGFFGLFLITFLSATILPLSSEVFLFLMLSNHYDPWNCLLIATLGNSLGGITNYAIGRLGKLSWMKKIGLKEDKIERYSLKVDRYGVWLAFFSFVPLIGDVLIVALGYFRANFLKVVFLLVLGKFLRYLLIVELYL